MNKNCQNSEQIVCRINRKNTPWFWEKIIQKKLNDNNNLIVRIVEKCNLCEKNWKG